MKIGLSSHFIAIRANLQTCLKLSCTPVRHNFHYIYNKCRMEYYLKTSYLSAIVKLPRINISCVIELNFSIFWYHYSLPQVKTNFSLSSTIFHLYYNKSALL